MANGNDTSPIPGYTMPEVHRLDTVPGAIGGDGFVLYGRDASSEMAATLNCYATNASLWASTNLTLGQSLTSNALDFSGSLKGFINSGLGSSALSLVPLVSGQQTRMDEMSTAAKTLLDEPGLAETENSQQALGLSAAMGGGHNSASALKDILTYEQKLQGKSLAIEAYAKVLSIMFQTYTDTGSKLSLAASQAGLQAGTNIPLAAPFESQLVGDIMANWQDTLNTGQLRNQQIRQTVAAGTAMDQFGPNNGSLSGITYSPSTWNASGWNAEFTTAYLGIKSQAKAAATI